MNKNRKKTKSKKLIWKNTPVGIKIISIFYFVLSALTLIMLIMNIPSSLMFFFFGGTKGGLRWILMLLYFYVPFLILTFLIGLGLLKKKKFFRILAIVLSSLWTIGTISLLIAPTKTATFLVIYLIKYFIALEPTLDIFFKSKIIVSIVYLIPNFLIIWYLWFNKKARQFFG